MKYTIAIKGMTCDNCASEIENTLNLLTDITATVSFSESLAWVEIKNDAQIDEVLKLIESEGYDMTITSNDKKNLKSNKNKIHIAIIGTGSGAFAAALKSVEKGARVTIIEGANIIGGTCVNIGCVPSKIFIRGANIAHIQGHHQYSGIALNTPKIDRKAMMQQQQLWVEKLRYAKYESILESNPDITLIRGIAHFKKPNTLIIKAHDGVESELQADRILITVGARPAVPDIKGLSATPYWTSTEALIAETLPKHLVVLGGSVVALELAQAFHHLGSQVTILVRSTLLSKEDPEVGKKIEEIFQQEGINIRLNTVPDLISYSRNGYKIACATDDIDCDQLLVATGRQSNADALQLNTVGIKTDNSGAITINDHMQTSVENVYAAGDCTDQPQFVYVAAAAGTRAARNMMGEDIAIDLTVMPAVVFTNPQVATVGLSEQQAINKRVETESRTLDLENIPRALANFDTRGFIKLVAEKESGLILGCQIVAAEGGEIIQTAALAIRNQMTIQELADQLFPYLTMVEGLKLTAQTFNKDVSQLSCCAG